MDSTKNHWEKIYQTKRPEEVSWTQMVPYASLEFIREAGLDKQAELIDIGGGDSRLVDFLLDMGFERITVLDISASALKRAQHRLGKQAGKINWIEADICDFQPTIQYDYWHDRAAFHFLTQESQIQNYIYKVRNALNHGGILSIGTFSETGPEKCSGLPIKQYSQESMVTAFSNGFKKIRCIDDEHLTPFGTTQNFTFCSFRAQK
jgi:cyclopropane fatty-acyl-phospholipid synthase-like methyltransferase